MTRVLSIHLSHFTPQPDFLRLVDGGIRHVTALASWYGNSRQNDIFTVYQKHEFGAMEAGLGFTPHMRLAPGILPQPQYNTFCARAGECAEVSIGVEDANGCAPHTISNRAKWMAEHLKQYYDRVLIYTRPDFLVSYARPMLEWMQAYPLWLARYVQPRGKLTRTWEQLRQQPDYAVENPLSPRGNYAYPHVWDMWQWTGDRYYLPGCGPDKRRWAADLSWRKV